MVCDLSHAAALLHFRIVVLDGFAARWRPGILVRESVAVVRRQKAWVVPMRNGNEAVTRASACNDAVRPSSSAVDVD